MVKSDATSHKYKLVLNSKWMFILLFALQQIVLTQCSNNSVTFANPEEQISDLKEKINSSIQAIQMYMATVDDSFKSVKIPTKDGPLTEMGLYLLRAIKLIKESNTTFRQPNIDVRFGEGDNQQLDQLEDQVLKFILHLMKNSRQDKVTINEDLVKQCVEAIRTYEYDNAAKILNLIDNDDNIHEIVSRVYAKEVVSNLYLITQFINAVGNPKREFLLIEAFYSEMKNDKVHGFCLTLNDVRAESTLTLYKSLKKLQHLYKNDLENNTITDGISNLMRLMKEDLKQYIFNFLNSLLYYKTIADIKPGKNMLDEIYWCDMDLLESIYTDYLLAKSFSGNEDIVVDLMKISTAKDDVGQRKTIVKSYLNVAKSNNYKNFMHSIMKFKTENPGLTSRYESVFNAILPISVYNLIFGSKFCIKNVGLNEYLKTGGGEGTFYNHDSERRNVYTDSNGVSEHVGLWQIKHSYKDQFNIFNNEHPIEYMYASISSYVKNRRIIWVWVPGKLDETGNWNIEPYGDYVYLKNHRDEYLYGSDNSTDKVEDWIGGHVYSLVDGSKTCKHQSCHWLIEDCSHL